MPVQADKSSASALLADLDADGAEDNHPHVGFKHGPEPAEDGRAHKALRDRAIKSDAPDGAQFVSLPDLPGPPGVQQSASSTPSLAIGMQPLATPAPASLHNVPTHSLGTVPLNLPAHSFGTAPQKLSNPSLGTSLVGGDHSSESVRTRTRMDMQIQMANRMTVAQQQSQQQLAVMARLAGGSSSAAPPDATG